MKLSLSPDEGHILTVTDQDFEKQALNCLFCGKPVKELPCYLCEARKQLIHEDCNQNPQNWKCKMPSEDSHAHFKIIEIKTEVKK